MSSKDDSIIRILHLSDLHCGKGDDILNKYQPLITDLTYKNSLNLKKLDFIVLSGDLTNRADPAEFKSAHDFIRLDAGHFPCGHPQRSP